MTRGSDVVLDASVAIRAVVGADEEARDWLGRIRARAVRGSWPQLAYAEVANALLTLVRAGRLAAGEADEALAYVLLAPIAALSLGVLAEPAFALALQRSLSAYDACYVTLAEALGVPLVTADRRLAEACRESILIAA